MLGRQRGGVFLSYARNDGEEFAGKLRNRMAEKAPDVHIKQDRVLLEGGVSWWKQIADAIDSVDFLVLVMTPFAMQSPIVRKEWQYARQQGVCVYPVKGAPDSELNFSELPRWMSKAHFFDIDKEWESFVQHLRGPCTAPRVPFMAPDLPATFVQRPSEFERLKGYLLGPERKEPVAITTALSGAGGFGKTTLAAALCHDEDVMQNFDDGILWVTLGQEPNVAGALLALYAALTGDRPGFASEEDAAFHLGQKLEDRTCLIVIDDVWDGAQLRPFLRGGKGCARLITTRDAEIASGAKRVEVDEMTGVESAALLGAGLPDLDSRRVEEVSRRLGEWPLVLELARATVQQRIGHGDTAEGALRHLMRVLDSKGAPALREDAAAERRHRSIDGVLEVSLKSLSGGDRKRLFDLSIFPEDIAIPLSAMGALWRLDEWETEEAAQRLARLSLLKLDLQRGTIRVHDVMRSWLAGQVSDAPELHSRLVEAWSDWHHLPDAYAWRWLAWHLERAGRKADLRRLLWDGEWLQAKLEATDTNALMADFEHLKPNREIDLMQGALRLSAHVLARDTTQLFSQLMGRLRIYELPDFWAMAGRFRGRSAWLRPLSPALTPPGEALLSTLSGHTGGVTAVAVYERGKRALSGSYDNTLKVWNLERGAELRTLSGHSSWVTAVSVYEDGKRAISASWDNTLKVWNLESGAELRTLSGHTHAVSAVVVYGDGKQAISGSYDNTLKLWDLESGTELRTLSGHVGHVDALAVYADGKRAISASWDNTLKVWDLKSATEVRTLSGHTHAVSAVAVYRDGKRAISGSYDNTLKVWDLESGAELHTLSGHSSWVSAVAVYEDGKRALSGSGDNTLKVWDLESGAELRTLSGHVYGVAAVAVYRDGNRALSAAWDSTLKLWDLETEGELRTPLPGHANTVNAVVVYGEGKRAISASEDHTLKLWDLESGAELRTLGGHAGGVAAVVVYGEGKQAISASWDKTLKVWDLESGAELRSLGGHGNVIDAVAVYGEGKWAVSASWDKTLKVWDLENGAELRTLSGHDDAVTSIAVDGNGKRALSASRGRRRLKLWDLESGAELRTLKGHDDAVTAVAVYANGKRALSASRDYTLKVWDLESGAELRTLSGHATWVTAVAVYGEDKRAISASDDDTLKVWNLESGAELRTLSGHAKGVTAVAVYDDGKRAISASDDNTLKVWDLETGKAIATFTADGPINAFDANYDKGVIVAGDALGRVHILSLVEPGMQ